MTSASLTTPVRAPRLRVDINGVIINSIVHAEVVNRGSYKSSDFELTASITGNIRDRRWLSAVSGRATVQIYMYSGIFGVGPPIFQGLADSISIDQTNGIARISGRDYSSVLIDSTYQDSFCNQTASEIANSIAARHGFNSNVFTTSRMVGTYQDNSYNQFLLNSHSHITSEWDLLTQLARSEQFELFVDGNVLVFAPSISLPRNNTLIDVGEVIGIRFHKNLPLSDQTTLTVKSWNSWLGLALYHSDGQSISSDTASTLDFSDKQGVEIAIFKPNLSPVDAEQLANRSLNLIKEQMLTVQITMPGEILMKPRDVITISGSQSSFDTNYVVRSVRREFSTTAGFIQYVQGFAIGNELPLQAGNGASLNG